MNTIKEILNADLKTAMLQKDTSAVTAIRTLRGRIDNAEAPVVLQSSTLKMAGGIAGASEDSSETEVPRKELSEQDIQDIVQKEISDAEQALTFLAESSLPDTEDLVSQIEVLKRYSK